MTKRILMPVDRFPRADAVAAIVADIARGSHAVVRLLGSVERVEWRRGCVSPCDLATTGT